MQNDAGSHATASQQPVNPEWYRGRWYQRGQDGNWYSWHAKRKAWRQAKVPDNRVTRLGWWVTAITGGIIGAVIFRAATEGYYAFLSDAAPDQVRVRVPVWVIALPLLPGGWAGATVYQSVIRALALGVDKAAVLKRAAAYLAALPLAVFPAAAIAFHAGWGVLLAAVAIGFAGFLGVTILTAKLVASVAERYQLHALANYPVGCPQSVDWQKPEQPL